MVELGSIFLAAANDYRAEQDMQWWCSLDTRGLPVCGVVKLAFAKDGFLRMPFAVVATRVTVQTILLEIIELDCSFIRVNVRLPEGNSQLCEARICKHAGAVSTNW